MMCFRFGWYMMNYLDFIFHVYMMIISLFLVIDVVSMDYYHTYFIMDTYPILACVWCACFLLYGVSNMVKEGSHSHLLVRIYMMHHFLPLPV